MRYISQFYIRYLIFYNYPHRYKHNIYSKIKDALKLKIFVEALNYFYSEMHETSWSCCLESNSTQFSGFFFLNTMDFSEQTVKIGVLNRFS